MRPGSDRTYRASQAKKPRPGPAEGHRAPERLALAHHDVRADPPGRFEHAQQDGVRPRPRGAPLRRERRRRAPRRSSSVPKKSATRREARPAGPRRPTRATRAAARSVVPARASTSTDSTRMTPAPAYVRSVASHSGCTAPDTSTRERFVTRAAIRRGFHERGRAVVHRRVRDVHARELADHRLVLVDVLQRPLRDLGLVGRVGREELRPAQHVIDDRGHVVVVAPRPRERDQTGRRRVGVGQRAQTRGRLHLRQPLGKGQRLVEEHAARNGLEQLVDVRDADSAKHGFALFAAHGCVAHPAVRPRWRRRTRTRRSS